MDERRRERGEALELQRVTRGGRRDALTGQTHEAQPSFNLSDASAPHFTLHCATPTHLFAWSVCVGEPDGHAQRHLARVALRRHRVVEGLEDRLHSRCLSAHRGKTLLSFLRCMRNAPTISPLLSPGILRSVSDPLNGWISPLGQSWSRVDASSPPKQQAGWC